MARPPPPQASPPCELCLSPAHVLCPSDDAFLCWRCDSMVHSANFLVARHHRTYLCSCCACPTMMVANGAILPSRSHLCARCSIIPTDDFCTTGSGGSDSECSALTSDCDAESALSCRCQSFTSFSTDRWKLDGNLDALTAGDASDGMSGVEDEVSSSGEFGTFSPTSYIGSGTQGSTVSHGRHGRSFCRSSRA